MKLSLTFSMRLTLLALLLIVGLTLSGGLTFLLGKASDNAEAVARIAIVAQDLLAFVLPAVVLAVLITRLPAEFLMIKTLPNGRLLGLAILSLIVSIPMIEGLNAACARLPWPDAVITAEAAAQAQIATIIGHSGMSLTVSILIIGVMTGLSEELFFRGALQRLLQTRPMSVHVAVWIAAALFSLMHAQPIGFVPRMLLGAFFGYAAVWTGSVWTAVMLHIINNSAAVTTTWADVNIASTPALAIVSAALTAAVIYLFYSKSRSRGI